MMKNMAIPRIIMHSLSERMMLTVPRVHVPPSRLESPWSDVKGVLGGIAEVDFVLQIFLGGDEGRFGETLVEA